MKHLRGYIRIKLEGYSLERFINVCKHKGIRIWDLEAGEHSYTMKIRINDFRQLKPIVKKTKTHITILERKGVPFFFHKYRKRKLFFGGLFVCLLIVFMFSKFVWNIEIEGNQHLTEEVLLEYLETQGVHCGMPREKVKCEAIVTGLRQNFNEITWASVSLDGCKVNIHIKENTDSILVNQTEEDAPADLISTTDGTILEIITRQGVPYVKEGYTVSTGDLLVSGTIDVLNDAGEVVNQEHCKADADIFAKVIIPYEDFCETVVDRKVYTNTYHKEVYIKVAKYRIALGIKKTQKENYEIRNEETQLKLNGLFEIPIAYGTRKGIGYQLEKTKQTQQEMEEILYNNLERYCNELENNGVLLLENKVSFYKTHDGMKAEGHLVVKQSITAHRKLVDF